MKSKLIQIVFLNILIVLFLLPTHAQEGEEIEESAGRGEFFVSVEDWFVLPGNTDYQIATILPSDPYVSESPVISIPFSYDTSLRYKIGWKFKDNLGSIAFVYWSFDADEQIMRTDPGNFVFTENLAFPLYAGAYDDGLADGVRGDYDVKAKSLSILFSRSLAQTERVQAHWRIGFRTTNCKLGTYVEYMALVPTLIDPFPPSVLVPKNDKVREASEFEALGIETGAAFHFPLAKRVSFGGSMGISLMRGEAEAKYVSSTHYYTDTDLNYFQAKDRPFNADDIQWTTTVFANANEKDSLVQVLDADLRFKWNFWNGFDLTVGYAASYWSGAILREELLLVEPSPQTGSSRDFSQFARPKRQDVAFEGAYLRVTYRY
jgi:hypothetical protein